MHLFACDIFGTGEATSRPLRAAGLEPVWESDGKDAETFADSLPLRLGPRLYYPASAAASDTLQKKLQARGFKVLNLFTTWTYNLILLYGVVHLCFSGRLPDLIFTKPRRRR